MRTHGTNAAGTEGKLVHTKWILVHFFVVAGTVSSVNDATLETEVNSVSMNSDQLNFMQYLHITFCPRNPPFSEKRACTTSLNTFNVKDQK